MLIAMPSLRDGPFARSVVYICAHRDDGAMGIVINQRAADIDFRDCWCSSRSSAETEAIRLPAQAERRPGAARRPGRHRPRLRPAFERLSRRRIRRCAIGGDICLTATLDILRAIATGRGAEPRGAGARLRRLGLGPARERDPRQRLAGLARPIRTLIFDSDFDAQIRPRAGHHRRQRRAWLSSEAGHA